jgi:hypothetical protein
MLTEYLFEAYKYTQTPYNEQLLKLIISDIDKYGYY